MSVFVVCLLLRIYPYYSTQFALPRQSRGDVITPKFQPYPCTARAVSFCTLAPADLSHAVVDVDGRQYLHVDE